jgi:hypothetical protein
MSIMPLLRLQIPPHDEEMSRPWALRLVADDYLAEERRSARRLRRNLKRDDRYERAVAGSCSVLITDRNEPGSLASGSYGPALRWWSHVQGFILDRRLATGHLPEDSRLLAARSVWLVSPSTRWSIAENWLDLLQAARRPAAPRDPRVSLCRDDIVRADRELRAMLDALVISLPVPVRGVAMANRLLCDGAGPLYNYRCPDDLQTTLREVARQLDPEVLLAGSAADTAE